MSDIGPIPPKDQTNYLLGRLEGSVNALKDTVVASAAAQSVTNAQHEAEHAEFRKTLTDHGNILAVLSDNKSTAQKVTDNRVQKWMVYLGIPTAVVTAGGALVWLLANRP